MRKILFFFLFAGLGLAQNPRTAEFPGAIADDQDLLVGNDRAWSALAATISDSDMSVTVASGDGSKFRNYTVITIQDEQILICSVSGDVLTVCTGGRGFSWTDAAQHLIGVAIRANVISWHHNQLAAELKAIEESLIGSSYIGTMIRSGGITSSFPAWKRVAAGWEARTADDGGYTTVKGFFSPQPSATTPGLNFGPYAGDPSSPSDGDAWYNSSTNKFRCYENGSAVNCVGAVDAATLASPLTTEHSLLKATAGSGRAIEEEDDCTVTDAGQLTCAEGFVAGGSAAGYVSLPEASGSGSNFRRVTVPDALTADLTYRFPDTLPAGSLLEWPTPTSSVSEAAHTPLSATSSAQAMVPKTEADGDLNAGFIGQDQNYTWTANHIYETANLELPNNTAPVGTDCDAAAEYGRITVDTDATSGRQVYVCESGGWVLQGGDGEILSTTDSTVDIASINDGACSATEEVALTGAALGDFVTVASTTDVLTDSVYVHARVSSANTVRYYVCNLSGAAHDPVPADYKIQIVRL